MSAAAPEAREPAAVPALQDATPRLARWLFTPAGHLALLLESFMRVGALRNEMVRLVFLRQVYFTGVQALPAIALVALAVGMPFVAEATSLLGARNPYLYDLMGWVLVSEAAPFVVAIVIIGRSATVVATELALLQVRGEVRALERMRIDPVDYLVVPRIAALTASMLASTLYCQVITVVGGFGASALLLHVSFAEQIGLLCESLSMAQLALATVKALVFGMITGTVACFAGLHAGPSVNDVPRAQLKAFMRSIVYIVITEVLFALPYVLDTGTS